MSLILVVHFALVSHCRRPTSHLDWSSFLLRISKGFALLKKSNLTVLFSALSTILGSTKSPLHVNWNKLPNGHYHFLLPVALTPWTSAGHSSTIHTWMPALNLFFQPCSWCFPYTDYLLNVAISFSVESHWFILSSTSLVLKVCFFFNSLVFKVLPSELDEDLNSRPSSLTPWVMSTNLF